MRKKNQVKDRFPFMSAYYDVRPINYLNKHKKIGNTKPLPKFVKLIFVDKDIRHKPGTLGVTCKMDCRLEFDLPVWVRYSSLFDDQYFSVYENALCSKGDKFDLDKGIKIAQAKAENEAYRIAAAMCKVAHQQCKELAEALLRPYNEFNRYKKHNKEFIDRIATEE